MSKSIKSYKNIILPAIVGLLAVGVLFFVLTDSKESNDKSKDTETNSQNTTNKDMESQTEEIRDFVERKDPKDPLAMGKVDAPVTMVIYSDFQCPFCGKFARDTEPQLIKKYVDTGKMRIEWRDFPYIGDESYDAAQAARAAGAQDKFWEFHDALYAKQPKKNTNSLNQKFFDGIAKKIGLNVKKFNKDLKSGSFDDDIEIDFNEGQTLGVTGAPAFLINGQPIIGAHPEKMFSDLIDAELIKAQSSKK